MDQLNQAIKRNKHLDPYLILTLVLSIFALAPLLYPGYFQTHAGFIPVWSIAELRENFFDLTWLPTLIKFDPWRSDGLLPYYVAALFPLSPLNALKLVSVGGILGGSSGLYLWVKGWLGAQGACVAALTYTYAPFMLATLYVRGAWGEAIFWGFLPWALLGATYLVARSERRFMILAIAFWLALGLSQLGLTLCAYIMLVLMMLLYHRPQALAPLLSAGLGLALAAIITIPRGGYSGLPPLPTNLTDHLLYPAQLTAPFWGYGLSQPGWDDGLSLSLGIASLGLTILSVSIWRGGPDRRPWLFLGLALIAVLLMIPPVGYLWGGPSKYLLLYPWQLLGFAGLGLAVVAGLGLWLNEKLQALPTFASLIIFIILPVYPHLAPQYITTPMPHNPEAIYGENQILLLWHEFVVENKLESGDFDPHEPYISIAKHLTKHKRLSHRDVVYLQVHWQAVTPIAQNYKIFAHLVDEAGQLIMQVDLIPQDGTRPTTTWLPGEIIEDRYRFTLRQLRTGTPVPHQVWLGFYHEETLIRLNILGDDEGRAKLDVK